jgi:nitric oxide dioxygenase
MDASAITLVQDSFEKVKPMADDVAKLFYDRLFEIAPETRRLFKSDKTEQGRKLMSTLGVVVSGLSNTGKIVSAVEALGRRHATYNVTEKHYIIFGEALLWTLEQGLGEAFTDEVRAAWDEAYGTLAEVMQNAAAESAAQAA